MTRVTKMKRQRVEEASEFQSRDLKDIGKSATEQAQPEINPVENTEGEGKKKRIRHRSNLPQDTQPEEQPAKHDASLTKAEREALKRRSRREKAKEKKMVQLF